MDALTTEPGTTELDATEPRLTELAGLAGCTGKAGAGAVTRVLELLTSEAGSGLSEPAELLVGLRKPDDAAVYRLSDELALVFTVDFFAPIVDDPYDYGAISAANALSDVYAMGGEPALALNISGFPIEMSEQRLAAILRGGADKVPEAGAVIAGGHTIIDAEPKYGLCVIGFVHPDRLFAKGGARPGELLYLTKPIGTGLITTAAKFEEAEPRPPRGRHRQHVDPQPGRRAPRLRVRRDHAHRRHRLRAARPRLRARRRQRRRRPHRRPRRPAPARRRRVRLPRRRHRRRARATASTSAPAPASTTPFPRTTSTSSSTRRPRAA